MTSAAIIERYVVDELTRSRARIDHEQDLLELGVLDSIAVVRLVSFLEAHFAIELHDEDLVPESFRSISAIARLVSRRIGAVAPAGG